MAEQKIPKVSVIVPVYNVQKFIERSVKSMMAQTLDDIEFIFIDDCTPDNSIQIVKNIISYYPQRNNSVIIIKHEVNKGLPAARNTGLSIANGEYIFHWDSDDYAEPEMLESMYLEAVNNNCDYIWSNWYLTFETNSRSMTQPNVKKTREALTEMLSGNLKYNVWNKLIARTLYTDTGILFPEGKSMGEDMTMIKLLVHAKKIGYVNKSFYHYIRINSGAMTQIYSKRHLLELRENVSDLCNYLINTVNDECIEMELNWFKLNVKLPLLFSGRKSDITLWKDWYPESNQYIMSNKRQSLRTRLLQISATHNLFFINSIYNTIVLKFIYGWIYR